MREERRKRRWEEDPLKTEEGKEARRGRIDWREGGGRRVERFFRRRLWRSKEKEERLAGSKAREGFR